MRCTKDKVKEKNSYMLFKRSKKDTMYSPLSSKKGMELSLNTIIIAVILLLFLVIYFFLFNERINFFTESTRITCDCNDLLSQGESCPQDQVRMHLPVRNPEDCSGSPKRGYCCVASN